MKRDGVNVAFEMILEEIQAVEAQLNQEGASAFRESRHQDAERLGSTGRKLCEFRRKLEALQKEWNAGVDVQTRERVKVEPGYRIAPHAKGPKTNLRITLKNGRVIQRPTAAQAMADAIESMGVEKVKALGIKVSGVPLVGTERHPRYGQTQLGQYLVCTHSSTKSKKEELERVARELNQTLRVEII
jgi:hypothetical protein